MIRNKNHITSYFIKTKLMAYTPLYFMNPVSFAKSKPFIPITYATIDAHSASVNCVFFFNSMAVSYTQHFQYSEIQKSTYYTVYLDTSPQLWPSSKIASFNRKWFSIC